MPVGAAYFTADSDAPSFGNYGIGTAVTVNFNRVFGLEGEVGAMLATTSDLQFGDLNKDVKAPNFLNYTGSIIVSPWTGHAVVPYAAIGMGGMTMFERPALGVANDETYLTGSVGGGLKWYAPGNAWGLRADYRFAVTQSQYDGPAFFGRDNRYAHRVSAGVIINSRR
jgi:hypothetical protein